MVPTTTLNRAELGFRLSEEGDHLFAEWEPGDEREVLDLSVVKALIEAQGFQDLYLDEAAVARLLEPAAPGAPTVEIQIAERRDGAFKIVVSRDQMTVRLTLTRAYGGAGVTEAQIRERLQELGVVAGVCDHAILNALSSKDATDVEIARGCLAEDGADSTFVSVVPTAEDRRPHVDEHGVTDLRDFGRIAVVSPGDPVMRRTPATNGTPGFDVTGKVLEAMPGKSIPFADKLPGVTRDAADPDLLRSAIVGRAVRVPDGMTVEPTIGLPQVDMSTGNIDFEGTVLVLGDVLARMKIRATGDVIVNGTVAAADIQAGRQVMLLGGFKGALDGEDAADSARGHEYIIRCGGTFHARFVEYAHVQAGGDILVDDHAMFSTLTAGRNVFVGGLNAKGQVVGGSITAIGQVTATKYGGPSGAKTLVQVGLEPKHRERLDQLQAEIKRLERIGGDAAELDRLRAEASTLSANLAAAEHAYVSVGRTIYPGTQIRIGAKRWSSFDEHTSGVFRVVDGEVMLCPQ